MNTQPKIKIVKRGRETVEPRQEANHTPAPVKPDAAKIVTEWVSEWRQRKSAETGRAFGSLFRKAA